MSNARAGGNDPRELRDPFDFALVTLKAPHLEAALGPVWYRRALAFDLWRLQIVLGRLVPVLYALVKA